MGVSHIYSDTIRSTGPKRDPKQKLQKVPSLKWKMSSNCRDHRGVSEIFEDGGRSTKETNHREKGGRNFLGVDFVKVGWVEINLGGKRANPMNVLGATMWSKRGKVKRAFKRFGK